MEVASIYAKNLQAKTDNQFIPESGSAKNFDDFINKAEAKNSQAQKTEKQSVRQNNPSARFKKVSSRQIKNSDVKDQDKVNQEIQPSQNENTSSEKNLPVEESGQTEGEVTVDVKNKGTAAVDATITDMAAINDQIIINLANKLNIPPEEITKVLDKLNIKPQELMDGDNLRSFVRELFGVESNVELLNIPNVNETFALINEALSNVTQIEKSEIAVASAGLKTDADFDTAKDLSFDDGLVAEEEPFLTPSDSGDKSGEIKIADRGANQGTSQNTDSGDEFTQGGDGEVIIEMQDDGDIVITADNGIHNNSQVIRVETRTGGEQTLKPAEIVNQVIERIKTDIKGNISEVKMHLKPESLGELSLKISIQNGIVTAQFVAENQRVKEIIESNLNELKDALSQSGVDVGALSVSVSSDNENEVMHAYERERQKSAKRISKIISDLNFAASAAEEVKIVSEEDVLETQVNYMA